MAGPTKIPNDLANRLFYLGYQSAPLTPVLPTHRVNGQPDISTSFPLIEEDNVNGTFMPLENPAFGLPEHSGTLGVTLSFENFMNLLRMGIGGGDRPNSGSAPAFIYERTANITQDEFDPATMQYGVQGDVWQASGIRAEQFNIEASVVDANSFWRWGSTLNILRNDTLPFTEVVASAGTAGVSEVQTLAVTGTPTGGTFTLTFKGQTTAPIAYNAASTAVDSALEALSTIGAGNVVCAGGPLPGSPVTVTFAGALAASDQPLITANGASLTGGSTPAAAVTQTTPGTAIGTLTMTAAGWTPDQFEGAWIFPDADTNKPGARQIDGNTTDTITPTAAFETTPQAGDVFLIAGLPVAGLPALVEEKIVAAGTKLYIDPFGTTIGTTQIRMRFISFNLTFALNVDAKTFMEDEDGPGGVYGRGELLITGQIRLEADRPDEWRQLKRLDKLAIRIEKEGSELADGVRKRARIDIPKAFWTERSRDTRNNNLTQTMAFRSILPVTFHVRNGLAQLP